MKRHKAIEVPHVYTCRGTTCFCLHGKLGAKVLLVQIFFKTITKTCLYNFDPLKPHFYIVKLGFTGVYIIFLILLKNIDCG